MEGRVAGPRGEDQRCLAQRVQCELLPAAEAMAIGYRGDRVLVAERRRLEPTRQERHAGDRNVEATRQAMRINLDDVTRKDVAHVTFGKGSPHLCLGNMLARMEIRLMFEELLPRLKSIELGGEVTRVRSNFVNGIKRFPVAVTPA